MSENPERIGSVILLHVVMEGNHAGNADIVGCQWHVSHSSVYDDGLNDLAQLTEYLRLGLALFLALAGILRKGGPTPQIP